MEVVRKNFKETLPQVSASIDKADFLVIDAEFTGLMNGRDVSIFDSPKEYYNRILNGCTGFLLIQFGLSAFYWDSERKHYMNETYNFYLFPRGRPGPEKMFMCQSSSLDFLIAQGFDFNKLIRDGISYMTETTETKLRENLTERQKNYLKEKDIINIPEQNKAYIDEVCGKVRQFIDEKESDEMVIDKCNAFVRLLLFQELRRRFRDEILVETKILENKNRILKVIRVKSQDDIRNHDTQKIRKEWEELEEAVGFSKVARMISQSEKLVIGHNMLLDVIHTLNHFFQPLPEDYNSFKEIAHCMFPSLLDTKYMSSLPPFKDKVTSSVLGHLLETLSEPPFSLPKVGSQSGRGYSRLEDKHHEAGYDAYITGLCFLSMHSHLTRMRGESDAGDAARPQPHSAVLKPFVNKLFLAKTAHQDSPYMNLSGADPTPSREHVFSLTFPKEWTRNDISQLFSPFGTITAQFEDDTHALVALTRRDQARAVMRTLANNNKVCLRSYDDYTKTRQQRADQETPSPRTIMAITHISSEVRSSGLPHVSTSSQEMPAKVTRVRANSITLPTGQMNRKRTSSGVFQVDETRKLAESAESTRSKPEGVEVNGRRIEKNNLSPTHSNRKRSSSGVFQADDLGPPPKKTEHAKPEVSKKNGRRKEKDTPLPENKKKREDKIIEKFDSEAKSVCVNAFKESDSWD